MWQICTVSLLQIIVKPSIHNFALANMFLNDLPLLYDIKGGFLYG